MLLLALLSGAGEGDADSVRPAAPPSGEIAFVSGRSGTVDIYAMNARGGAERALTRNRPTASAVDWSADGRFAFTSWDFDVPQIWTADENGGALRRLGPGADPAWSPDGRLIAFGRSDEAIATNGVFVMRSDGTNVRRVASTGENAASRPSWSPDGGMLVFATFDAIRTVDLSSGKVAVIRRGDFGFPSGVPSQVVEWSPDGSLIALEADDVFVMTPTGREARNLTRTPDDYEEALSWRPDGTLTFMREERRLRYGVYSVRADGSDLRRLFSMAADDFPRLDWSGEGSRAVVSSAYDSTVVVLRSDGSGKRRILIGDAHTGPAWSPDGMRLAVSGNANLLVLDAGGRLRSVPSVRCSPPISWAPGGKRLVCGEGPVLLVTLAGSRARQRVLLRDRGMGDSSKSDADWSPDGRRLVYVEDEGALALFDFAHPRTTASEYIPLRGLNADISAPVWSPDGRRVAFAASCSSPCRAGIYVVKIDGRGLRRVTTGGDNPEWSPDGSRIAFDNVRRGNRDVYAVNAGGTHMVRLTSAPGPDVDPTWRGSK